MNLKIEQQLAVKTAREFLSGKINFEELLDSFPDDTDDKDINELFDLIEHQPKLGGFLGVNEESYNRYILSIERVIERIENKIKNNETTTKPIS
jgi:hypothetical protein